MSTVNSSVLAIAVANLLTLAVALVADWGLGELFRTYWYELMVIGVIAVLQIRYARRPGAFAKSRGYQGIFFVAHYGTYCVAYGAVMAAILGSRWEVPAIFWAIVLVPITAFAAAHAVAFRFDFLQREAALLSSMQAALLPYMRTLPVQAPLIIAAALLPADISSRAATILFALGKTLADVVLVVARRKRIDAENP